LLYFEACDLALQFLPEFGGGDILNGGAIDHTDGGGDITFDQLAIADDDLLKGIGLPAEPDVN
jgi:hypothetical protein